MSSKSIKSLALVITICSCLAFYRGIPTGRATYAIPPKELLGSAPVASWTSDTDFVTKRFLIQRG